MPRFFFHVLDGKASIDHVGTELADVEAAEKEAMRTAGDIIRSRKMLGRHWSMTVVDEKDLVLLRLNFDALNQVKRDGGRD